MVARMPDDAARDFVRALEIFPGRGRSSHPTPAKGACVPRYAASERLRSAITGSTKRRLPGRAAAMARDSWEESAGGRRPGERDSPEAHPRRAGVDRDALGRGTGSPPGADYTGSAPG